MTALRELLPSAMDGLAQTHQKVCRFRVTFAEAGTMPEPCTCRQVGRGVVLPLTGVDR